MRKHSKRYNLGSSGIGLDYYKPEDAVKII